MPLLNDFNHARYRPGQRDGHYESFFQRANHPQRPLAFWIRYTIFSPARRPQDAVGQIWGMFFNGESGRHCVVKREFPMDRCDFLRTGFAVRVGDCETCQASVRGYARTAFHSLSWNLSYRDGQAPVFLLPQGRYGGAFPRAKSVVGAPMARYSGTLIVDNEKIEVQDWVGSQNHNWGSRHTDSYAWGQVCGFDNAPDSFLEVASARLKFGPLWTPVFTPMVLRHQGREYALNSLPQSVFRARGHWEYFVWRFHSAAPGLRIEGCIQAPKNAFVGLRYYNPPGGEKCCLNSKIASCTLRLQRPGQPDEVLQTAHRAAFEILTNDRAHGVEIRA